MTATDRWPQEMQLLQESLVWLVPDAEMARTLVSEAGIPEGFIDFGEPVWNRIKRIMVEAEKREMMPQLLAVISRWYPENSGLAEAKAAWEAGDDRRAAARRLRRAAKAIPDPIAVAKVTRQGDLITDVEVDVEIPHAQDDRVEEAETVVEIPVVTTTQAAEPDETTDEELPGPRYSDELQPGDWYSVQMTLIDQERRLTELEQWRQQLSIYPTLSRKAEGD